MDVTSYSVILEWKAWDPDVNGGDPPIVAYGSYVDFNTTAEMNVRTNSPITSTTIGSLQANTSYEFRVAAVREGDGGTGPPSPAVEAKTLIGKHCYINNEVIT